MDIGISLPSVGAPTREFVLQVAAAAERLGFSSVWASDHVILPRTRKSVYPYPESTTESAFAPGVMWLDPLMVMGVVAGATTRIAVGSHILVLPYRNPIILANEMASLDVLSHGRVLLGVGAGWMDEEFEALGVPRSERGARTDEYIELMRALWRADGPTSFLGKYFRFDEMQLATRPHTTGGPPIWVGGNTPAALRRVGRVGDGWLGFEVFPDRLPDSITRIKKAALDAGRDPSSIVLSVRRGLLPTFQVTNFLPERRSVSGQPIEVADELNRYADAGVTLIVFDVAMPHSDLIKTMEWFSGEVVPLLR